MILLMILWHYLNQCDFYRNIPKFCCTGETFTIVIWFVLKLSATQWTPCCICDFFWTIPSCYHHNVKMGTPPLRSSNHICPIQLLKILLYIIYYGCMEVSRWEQPLWSKYCGFDARSCSYMWSLAVVHMSLSGFNRFTSFLCVSWWGCLPASCPVVAGIDSNTTCCHI